MEAVASHLPSLAAFAIVFGTIAGWLGRRVGRNPLAWLAFGAVLGPAAIALLLVAPPGRCRTCDAAAPGWPARCAACGRPMNAAVRNWVGAEDATPLTFREAWAHAEEAHAEEAQAAPAVVATWIVEEPAAVGSLAVGGGASAVTDPSRASARDPVVGRPVLAAIPGGRPWPAGEPAGAARPSAAERGAPPAGGPAVDGTVTVEEEALPQILASGIFTFGHEPLAVGGRYLLARTGARFQVLGPLESAPGTVAADWPLDGLEASGAGGQIVLSRQAGRGRRVLTFTAIAGADPAAVAEALSPREP